MPRSDRRQYGTGSVYQRSHDGRWVGTVDAGFTQTGARRRITVSAKTEAACKAKLKERQRQIAQGVPVATRRVTVKAWADEYLSMAVHSLRPKSYDADRAAIRKWIVPTIGHKKVDALTPADVRAVTNAQRQAGLSSSTFLRTHRVLVKMLKAAREEGHHIPEAVTSVKAPSRAIHDRTAFETREAIAVLEQASYLPHGSRYLAAFLQGMRQGECLGLTWESVDLDTGWLTVSWQLQALPYLDPKNRALGFRIPDGFEARQLQGAYHLVRPKSRKGWRVIPMVPLLRKALTAWRELAPENPHDLVWSDLDGSPTDKKADLEEWYALQCTAEVGHPAGRYYYTHEARHTTATLLMEAGVDSTVRTAIMGHSSIAVTQGYQHARKPEALTAMEKVADRLQLNA